MKLNINNSNFGNTEIISSTLFYDEFAVKWNEYREKLYEKLIGKEIYISLISNEIIYNFKGIIQGGSDNSININRISDIQEINLIK